MASQTSQKEEKVGQTSFTPSQEGRLLMTLVSYFREEASSGMVFMSVLRKFDSGFRLWTGNLTQNCVTSALSLSMQSLLELEVDLDNLELDDIDAADINLDEDILDDWTVCHLLK